jgi:hypothetical protein
MRKAELIPVVFVSALLGLYCLLILFNIYLRVAWAILSLSPLLLAWTAYSIIRHGKYNGAELKEGEEWGYSDRSI